MKEIHAVVLTIVMLVSMGAAPVASAGTTDVNTNTAEYDIVINPEKGVANVTVDITVYKSQNYDDYSLQWRGPASASITSVTSTQGEASYSVENGRINSLKEEDGPPRSSETFTIEYTQSVAIEKVGGVGKTRFHLAGLSTGETTATVSIKGDAPVESVFAYRHHSVSKDGESAVVSDTRELSFYVTHSNIEPTVQSSDLTAFGESNLTQAELQETYENAKYTTGFSHDSGFRFPVVFVNSTESANLNGDSLGMFQGGVIYIEKDSAKEVYPILSHEVSHALVTGNMGTTPDWFSEGTAQMAQSVALDRIGESQDMFTRVRDLQEYNENEYTSIYTDWFESDSFRYDYSEARMKIFLQQEGGISGLNNAFSELAQEEKYRFTSEEISSVTGIELTPICEVDDPTECASAQIAYTPQHDLGDSVMIEEDSTSTPTTTEVTTTETTTEESRDSNWLSYLSGISISLVLFMLVLIIRERKK
jgi:hypothetical protein